MSRAIDARRLLRRIDVRLGLALLAAIGALLVLLMSTFFLIATHETAEILDELLRGELAAAAAHPGDGTPLGPRPGSKHHAAVAIRRIDADGRSTLLQGSWPTTGRAFPGRSSALRLAFADPEDHLLERRKLPEGGVLEGTLSLEQFVGERRELLAQILWSLAFSGIGLLALAAAATRLALAPLRSATRAVERIDEHHLDARIPVRGSDDAMDRHARALNHVLARLEDAFERMAAFSADVAHELRTPVNRILNLADLALLRGTAGEAPAELVALRRAAEAMQRVIDDLLLLARGEEGRLDVRGDAIPLAETISALVELFRPTCEERGITLGLRLLTPAPEARGDRHLLERALSNLLDNAVRHTPRGGAIEVALADAGAWVELAVSDSGPGIPERDRERVFGRFVQLDEARAAGAGAGLGLALVQMIARLQGGDVRVEKAALGGACFRIRLPVAPRSAAL
jgi:signal transduction histidine kinase